MTELYVCTPTYKRFDLLVKMIDSCENGSVKPDGYVILDNSAGQLIPYLETHAQNILDTPNLEIVVAGYNMGVARGWNALLSHVQQSHGDTAWCLIVNDDIELHEQTIAAFKQTIETPQEYGLVVDPKDPFFDRYPILCGEIDNINAFSMFATNPKHLYTSVGWFDNTIWPAYHEDGDMHWRMRLKGMDLYRVSGATATHNENGSATLKAFTPLEESQHHHQFRRNQTYYHSKWGGLPGKESYLVAFDNRDIMGLMQQIRNVFGF